MAARTRYAHKLELDANDLAHIVANEEVVATFGAAKVPRGGPACGPIRPTGICRSVGQKGVAEAISARAANRP